MSNIKFKIVLIVLTLFILLCSILLINNSINSRDIKLVDTAINLSSEYLKTYRGTENLNIFEGGKFIDLTKIKEDFDELRTELESNDKLIYDLTNKLDSYEIYVTLDDGTVMRDLAKNYVKSYETDECIKKDGGKVYVYLKDMDIKDKLFFTVMLEGVEMAIELESEFESYQDMKKNPEYLFDYVNHKYNKDDKIIDIKYVSKINKENVKIVRCKVFKGKIVSIGIK